MNRFRPNLVTSGGAAWAEDTWEAFQVKGAGQAALEFAGVKPCSRCKVGPCNEGYWQCPRLT